MFHPKSLQQRTVVFILAPIFLLLTLAGWFGYQAVRKVLLDQWSETAQAKLERAAHNIDMELNRPKQLLFLLEGLTPQYATGSIRNFIIDQVKNVDGVVKVKVDWPQTIPQEGIWFMRHDMMGGRTHHGARGVLDITAPAYNVEHGSRTFSMVSKFVDDKNQQIGKIEVVIDFESLLAQTVKTPWWKIYKAYLVDLDGKVLISTVSKSTASDGDEKFGDTGALEQKTFAALKNKASGTVFGPGGSVEEISGFYRLKEAPWTLVIVAPGEKVLQPIIHFRLMYFLTAFVCIGIILLFIRLIITQTTHSIKKVSQRASDLARGVFSEPLIIPSRDEVGELTRNFNTLTRQLEKGVQLQKAMDIAREVQLTLLPHEDYVSDGVHVSGLSIYCDETGGDYFDFMESVSHPGRLHVMVGDVVGHGIGAALLMATLRALVRARIDHSGTADGFIMDVNRQLCRDTAQNGNFASLFYLGIDEQQRELHWVRAGHDPAIMFFPARGEFRELKGKGLVLGLDSEYGYQNNIYPLPAEDVVLLIVSDGAWEVENEENEQFGKQRLQKIMAANPQLAPDDLLYQITDAINAFRGSAPLNDDITLVAIRVTPPAP